MLSHFVQALAVLILAGSAGVATLQDPRGGDRPTDARDRSIERDRRPQVGDAVRDRPHDRRFHRPLTPEMREAVIGVIGDLRPLSEEDRQKLREMDPERLRAFLEQGDQIMMLVRLRQARPELYQLKVSELKLARESYGVARQVVEARRVGRREAARDAETRLNQVVADQFAVEVQVKEHEIRVLEEQLQRKRAELERMNANRDDVVRERTQKVIERVESGEPPFRRDRRDDR